MNNKGLAYYNLEEYKKAINCYDQVLQIDPKNIDTFNYKGLAYNNLKEYKMAIDWFNKALQI